MPKADPMTSTIGASAAQKGRYDPKTKGETVGSDILQRMREDILGCTLAPGTKLRFEALRTRYDVSFSTLREALARLVAESLVVAHGQRGFAVAPSRLTI